MGSVVCGVVGEAGMGEGVPVDVRSDGDDNVLVDVSGLSGFCRWVVFGVLFQVVGTDCCFRRCSSLWRHSEACLLVTGFSCDDVVGLVGLVGLVLFLEEATVGAIPLSSPNGTGSGRDQVLVGIVTEKREEEMYYVICVRSYVRK